MIPKKIWMFWLQGWDSAPEVVKACVQTWKRHNPGWEIRLITAEDLPILLANDPGLAAVKTKELPADAFSNLVRLGLLLRYGGVWADATTYCMVPLDRWITEAAKSGFFGFANPGIDRMLSSWFLAATPNHIILNIMQDYCVDYWNLHDKRHTHFWFHGFLFRKCYEENAAFRKFWDITPKISADGPHHFTPYAQTLQGSFSDEDWQNLLKSKVQLLKLTHKLPEGAMEPGRPLPYLIEKALSKDGVMAGDVAA